MNRALYVAPVTEPTGKKSVTRHYFHVVAVGKGIMVWWAIHVRHKYAVSRYPDGLLAQSGNRVTSQSRSMYDLPSSNTANDSAVG